MKKLLTVLASLLLLTTLNVNVVSAKDMEPVAGELTWEIDSSSSEETTVYTGTWEVTGGTGAKAAKNGSYLATFSFPKGALESISATLEGVERVKITFTNKSLDSINYTFSGFEGEVNLSKGECKIKPTKVGQTTNFEGNGVIAKKEYTIESQATQNGSFVVKKGDAVTDKAHLGDTITVIPTADAHYAIKSVKVNGEEITDVDGKYPFEVTSTLLAKDTNKKLKVKVEFKQVEFTVKEVDYFLSQAITLKTADGNEFVPGETYVAKDTKIIIETNDGWYADVVGSLKDVTVERNTETGQIEFKMPGADVDKLKYKDGDANKADKKQYSLIASTSDADHVDPASEVKDEITMMAGTTDTTKTLKMYAYAYQHKNEGKDANKYHKYKGTVITKMVWNTEDPEIATIDQNGNIYAFKKGVTYFTITTPGTGDVRVIKVTVTENTTEEKKYDQSNIVKDEDGVREWYIAHPVAYDSEQQELVDLKEKHTTDGNTNVKYFTLNMYEQKCSSSVWGDVNQITNTEKVRISVIMSSEEVTNKDGYITVPHVYYLHEPNLKEATNATLSKNLDGTYTLSFDAYEFSYYSVGFSYKKVSPEVMKDETCEKVVGPTWHWNDTKGVCEEYASVRTHTR